MDEVSRIIQLESIVDWVFQCYDPQKGGFGGNVKQDPHLLYTLSALQILALADSLEDERLQTENVIQFIANLQQTDGSFAGDRYGEIDTRFTYCALSSLALLKALDRVNVDAAAKYIVQCRNLDGGFGCVIGAESHTGQIFTCVGALAIAKRLDLLDKEHLDLLGWWLSERQCDSGGLNGRSEKQADLCYSFWAITGMMVIDTIPWINKDKLCRFILNCQDPDDGGLADRPDDMVDVFHTFFGIAGLSLLGYLHQNPEWNFRQIDPIYALPTDLVEKLGLPGQVFSRKSQELDPRLSSYEVLEI